MKKGVLISAALLFSVLSIIFISAGISADLTGKATSQPTNVTVTITGTTIAQIKQVIVSPSYNPIEDTYSDIVFYVIMADPDGVSDLNDTSVSAVVTKAGQATRSTPLCNWVNDIDATSANYSCTIRMWYWDGAGSWLVNASGKDTGNGTFAHNDTQTFTYNQLKAMMISPQAIYWNSLNAGTLNQSAANDPTLINNTGNYNGTVSVGALDLFGEVNASYKLTAENFTSHYQDPGVCGGTGLVNGTAITIAGANSNPGNLSIGGGVGQSNLYYCIPNVPYVLAQTYSTALGGSWTIGY